MHMPSEQVKLDKKVRPKKTKETMLIEPLPIFDCMYCVKDSKMIFIKMSERYLSLKYSECLAYNRGAQYAGVTDLGNCIEQ